MEEREPLIVGKHYPAIDGLRGVAVLLVMWFHSSYFVMITIDKPLGGVSWAYYIFSVMGETGVDLFFVLSGFLITGILIDTCHQKHNFRNFYIRRILRIFPLYYGVLFVFLAYFLYIFGLDGLDHGKIGLHLFYLQNWMFSHNADQFILLDHTWSLAVEEQFYLLWPLVLLSFYKAGKMRPAMLLCLGLIALSWCLRLYLGWNEAYKWAYTFTPARFDNLAFGALLSLLCIQKSPWLKHLRKVSPYIIAVCFVMVSTLMFLGAMKSGDVEGANHASVVYGLIIFSVLHASLLAYVFLNPTTNLLNCILSIKPMRMLGKISYGLYLFHVPVMMIGVRFLYDNSSLGYWPAHVIVLLGGGGVSFLMAYLSYHFYEKLFLRLKDKFAPLESK
jgi:peptidoglycan/LPS O-acetylase OafA/YrhL